MLVSCFNMPPGDYKRFLTFLHKHRCHVRYQPFRTLDHEPPVDLQRLAGAPSAVATAQSHPDTVLPARQRLRNDGVDFASS
jgi:hypothetical protein